ncbi:hypothetical protein ACFPT7_24635 [Acidicapsa dinghuensis]|uniref:Glycosyl hydrolase family 79 n=1 Tax=Acidicapsa dinghuensis TaxID=2218256 RepID=A0ABW1ENT9_9BACT|nr:hypothetical protein [Acidicapsa dinghuensis]
MRLAPIVVSILTLLCSRASVAQGQPATATENVKTLPKLGVVNDRFQSYNIEMVEVTGGRFWKPYASTQSLNNQTNDAAHGNQPAGLSANLFEYRPPIDLNNPTLRKLAAALGPAYLRVSGTWANSTYFDPDGTAGEKPPAGFQGVLTGTEWRGVLDFAKAVNADLVTSFAVSAGTRDKDGLWTPVEANKIASFTTSAGGHISAAELINEPTFPEIDGLGKSYDATAFARDVHAFREFAKHNLPGMLVVGPGGVGEGATLMPGNATIPGPRMLSTADLLKATGPAFDAFSYHSYGAVSVRCNPGKSTNINDSLSTDTFSKAEQIARYYMALRDQYDPGKPMWNTETAEAACGGDSWASEFADTFRYLKQLGDLARIGVRVNMHNTLSSSDYGLLDENTYEPRPDYWAALLWHRLMGSTVLDAGSSQGENLYLYAHCMPQVPGGVTVLAINADGHSTPRLKTGLDYNLYTLSAGSLDSKQVMLNGHTLSLNAANDLPRMEGSRFKAGTVDLNPQTITFLAFPEANNASCR